MLRPLLKWIDKHFGIVIACRSAIEDVRVFDLSPEVKTIIRKSLPYALTSVEGLATVCLAIEHLARNEIPGAYVECGVWRGGSSMAAAWSLLHCGRPDVDLYLFDTFSGMTAPSEEDILTDTGESAASLLAKHSRKDAIWAYAPLQEVRRNMRRTSYPEPRIHFIPGKVEETLPGQAPETIALLRLDTDWYASTKQELEQLFPRLAKGGILIIDDYGTWSGARKAVDEYFASQNLKPFLGRIDNTGRIVVK